MYREEIWFIYGKICGIRIWLLRTPYPDLFGIACANEAFVAIHLELLGGST